jgi:hypothetical protein
MEKEALEDLIERYIMGLTSEEEDAKLKRWYEDISKKQASLRQLSEAEMEALREKMLQRLLSDAKKQPSLGAQKDNTDHGVKNMHLVDNKEASNKFRSLFKNNAWAAVILLLICCSTAAYFFHSNRARFNKTVVKAPVVILPGENIAPGQSGATLHLANGKAIPLDNLQNGLVAEQNGVKILKDKNGVTYVGKANAPLYNDITTGRGQQWQLTLPDGTKVWLNAVSSIHYPLAFSGQQRMVSITGEAYFEVVHNAKQPFTVKAGNTVIEDIGTAFNINAYADEPFIKTTLVHGSVKVSTEKNSSLLKPGQQAATSAANKIKVIKVNTENITGWMNGALNFDNEDLGEVMKKVARWYDIDVTYAGKIPKRTFAGSISRKMNLSEFLKLLEFENVDFKLDGKKITILP